MSDSLDRTTFQRNWTPSVDGLFPEDNGTGEGLTNLVLFNNITKYGTTIIKTPSRN